MQQGKVEMQGSRGEAGLGHPGARTSYKHQEPCHFITHLESNLHNVNSSSKK